MTAAVLLQDVTKRYGRTLALDAVSFEVAAGEFFALLGPNGAGKSTLLHILCAILRPDSGRVTVGGIDLRASPLAARSRLGVVFQEPSLDDRLTVTENLEFHGLVYGVPRALRRNRIAHLLEAVDLTARRDAPVRGLSSGMKRRLELARALIHDSQVLLLDEPTVGLDVQSRANFWRQVEALRAERGLTVIVATHAIDEVETADRVCIIDAGRLVALDRPAVLMAAHGRETIRFHPREPELAAEILQRYPKLATRSGGSVIVEVPDPAFRDAFLAQYGPRATEFAVEQPSLENAFLALTGRALRDQPAADRERTLAFARQGGEHTR